MYKNILHETVFFVHFIIISWKPMGKFLDWNISFFSNFNFISHLTCLYILWLVTSVVLWCKKEVICSWEGEEKKHKNIFILVWNCPSSLLHAFTCNNSFTSIVPGYSKHFIKPFFYPKAVRNQIIVLNYLVINIYSVMPKSAWNFLNNNLIYFLYVSFK